MKMTKTYLPLLLPWRLKGGGSWILTMTTTPRVKTKAMMMKK
ncbi:hypothetical protein Gohar_020728 [Gossypium harknessii]|uniref:Uncharacterized protein n=1 Tax=Gossypium harknessii TaxID=34285 RepID=A0A7J9HZ71_9ROSI|nr:hypothetical protein [Gossypium harknessii]